MNSRNLFCFAGGYIGVAVTLPGLDRVAGLLSTVWAMENLGRARYGVSSEGGTSPTHEAGCCGGLTDRVLWRPCAYSMCDVGTVPNQTWQGIPEVSAYPGDKYSVDGFSYLPGQRLSRCTCPGEKHPGLIHNGGTFVGRSPEIDVFEAMIYSDLGVVSQSGQRAPFNAGYKRFNTTDNFIVPDPTVTELNPFTEGRVFCSRV